MRFINLPLALLCVTTASGQCPLCFDGTAPPDLDYVPPAFEVGGGTQTCGDAVVEAAKANASDPNYDQTCFEWLVAGLFCGCQTPPGGCTLCHDGSAPTQLDYNLGGSLEGATCGGAFALAAFPDAAVEGGVGDLTCADWEDVGLLCGCPIPPGGCPLCFDGSLPPDLTYAPPEVENGQVTCNQLRAVAADADGSLGGSDNSTTCEDWLPVGLFCGCPVPDSACSLCEDDGPVPNPDDEQGGNTCGFWVALGAFADPMECLNWQATVGVYCGCDNPIASQDYCRICGGDTLLPDTNIVVHNNEDGDDITCGEIEFNEDKKPCQSLQDDYADPCGCPDIVTLSPTEAPAVDSTNSPTEAPTKPSDGGPDQPSLATQTATTTATTACFLIILGLTLFA